jgi:hypothetical protein
MLSLEFPPSPVHDSKFITFTLRFLAIPSGILWHRFAMTPIYPCKILSSVKCAEWHVTAVRNFSAASPRFTLKSPVSTSLSFIEFHQTWTTPAYLSFVSPSPSVLLNLGVEVMASSSQVVLSGIARQPSELDRAWSTKYYDRVP